MSNKGILGFLLNPWRSDGSESTSALNDAMKQFDDLKKEFEIVKDQPQPTPDSYRTFMKAPIMTLEDKLVQLIAKLLEEFYNATDKEKKENIKELLYNKDVGDLTLNVYALIYQQANDYFNKVEAHYGKWHVFLSHGGLNKEGIVGWSENTFHTSSILNVFLDEKRLELGNFAMDEMIFTALTCDFGFAYMSHDYLFNRKKWTLREFYLLQSRYQYEKSFQNIPIFYDGDKERLKNWVNDVISAPLPGIDEIQTGLIFQQRFECDNIEMVAKHVYEEFLGRYTDIPKPEGNIFVLGSYIPFIKQNERINVITNSFDDEEENEFIAKIKKLLMDKNDNHRIFLHCSREDISSAYFAGLILNSDSNEIDEPPKWGWRWWIDCSSKESMEHGLVKLCDELKIPTNIVLSKRVEHLVIFMRKYNKNKPYVIIFFSLTLATLEMNLFDFTVKPASKSKIVVISNEITIQKQFGKAGFQYNIFTYPGEASSPPKLAKTSPIFVSDKKEEDEIQDSSHIIPENTKSEVTTADLNDKGIINPKPVSSSLSKSIFPLSNAAIISNNVKSSSAIIQQEIQLRTKPSPVDIILDLQKDLLYDKIKINDMKIKVDELEQAIPREAFELDLLLLFHDLRGLIGNETNKMSILQCLEKIKDRIKNDEKVRVESPNIATLSIRVDNSPVLSPLSSHQHQIPEIVGGDGLSRDVHKGSLIFFVYYDFQKLYKNINHQDVNMFPKQLPVRFIDENGNEYIQNLNILNIQMMYPLDDELEQKLKLKGYISDYASEVDEATGFRWYDMGQYNDTSVNIGMNSDKELTVYYNGREFKDTISAEIVKECSSSFGSLMKHDDDPNGIIFHQKLVLRLFSFTSNQQESSSFRENIINENEYFSWALSIHSSFLRKYFSGTTNDALINLSQFLDEMKISQSPIRFVTYLSMINHCCSIPSESFEYHPDIRKLYKPLMDLENIKNDLVNFFHSKIESSLSTSHGASEELEQEEKNIRLLSHEGLKKLISLDFKITKKSDSEIFKLQIPSYMSIRCLIWISSLFDLSKDEIDSFLKQGNDRCNFRFVEKNVPLKEENVNELQSLLSSYQEFVEENQRDHLNNLIKISLNECRELINSQESNATSTINVVVDDNYNGRDVYIERLDKSIYAISRLLRGQMLIKEVPNLLKMTSQHDESQKNKTKSIIINICPNIFDLPALIGMIQPISTLKSDILSFHQNYNWKRVLVSDVDGAQAKRDLQSLLETMKIYWGTDGNEGGDSNAADSESTDNRIDSENANEFDDMDMYGLSECIQNYYNDLSLDEASAIDYDLKFVNKKNENQVDSNCDNLKEMISLIKPRLIQVQNRAKVLFEEGQGIDMKEEFEEKLFNTKYLMKKLERLLESPHRETFKDEIMKSVLGNETFVNRPNNIIFNIMHELTEKRKDGEILDSNIQQGICNWLIRAFRNSTIHRDKKLGVEFRTQEITAWWHSILMNESDRMLSSKAKAITNNVVELMIKLHYIEEFNLRYVDDMKYFTPYLREEIQRRKNESNEGYDTKIIGESGNSEHKHQLEMKSVIDSYLVNLLQELCNDLDNYISSSPSIIRNAGSMMSETTGVTDGHGNYVENDDDDDNIVMTTRPNQQIERGFIKNIQEQKKQ